MDVNERIAGLYGKDTRAAYAHLQALEALSEREDTLYPHLGEFIAMLESDRYVLRVRGFRLVCKQAKWDTENRIDGQIDAILAALDDEKPTAVRQALQYLEEMAPHKKALWPQIRQAAASIDLSRFKDSMLPLIEKDIGHLLRATQPEQG